MSRGADRGGDSSNPTCVEAPSSTEEVENDILLRAVVDGQTTDGSWTYGSVSLEVVGVVLKDFKANIPEEVKSVVGEGKAVDVWVTVIVIVWLETKRAEKEGTWRLMRRKALEWLRTQGVKIGDLKSKVALA